MMTLDLIDIFFVLLINWFVYWWMKGLFEFERFIKFILNFELMNDGMIEGAID
jgi:hypothetical protein